MTKILLVEDDKSLREIYGVRLLAEGYDIVSAGDGEEALAMAIKDRPTLIVSDVMMPKISGFDMLDILRSTTETKDIKVIMMTALSSEDQRQRGVALGADRYLVKSQVGIEDVVRTVHEVLGDAPIASLSSSPAAAANTPTPTPTMGPRPASSPMQSPGPRPSAPPAPAFNAPAPAAPFTPQAAPAPAPVSPVTSPAPVASASASSTLPQPTAPFSTPRPGSLADRVIQPLPASEQSSPDFGHLMNQELGESSPASAPAPATPSAPSSAPAPVEPVTLPPVPPAPVAPMPEGLNFEETPRPPQQQPPSAPQPPQAPNPGV